MMTLVQLMRRFDTDVKCREHLEKVRWPEGIACPRCKAKSISRIKTRNQFDCNACRYRFSVTTGTIFFDSHIPLTKWFAAIHLMCQSKKGMSANQLKRDLELTYRSAWYMCHRIRNAMKHSDFEIGLCGIIEMDETYAGSPKKNPPKPWKRGRGTERKMAVVGMKERGGRVRTEVMATVIKKNITNFVKANAGNVDEFQTDTFGIYNGLIKLAPHKTVDHDQWYVSSEGIHCNGIESHWSLLKRGVVGTFHKISTKHLHRYCSEFEHRGNCNGDAFDQVFAKIERPHMTYRELVESPDPLEARVETIP